jgi:hypothetical protein
MALQSLIRQLLVRKTSGTRCHYAARDLQLLQATPAFLRNNVDRIDGMGKVYVSTFDLFVDAVAQRLAVGCLWHLLQLLNILQALVALGDYIWSVNFFCKNNTWVRTQDT